MSLSSCSSLLCHVCIRYLIFACLLLPACAAGEGSFSVNLSIAYFQSTGKHSQLLPFEGSLDGHVLSVRNAPMPPQGPPPSPPPRPPSPPPAVPSPPPPAQTTTFILNVLSPSGSWGGGITSFGTCPTGGSGTGKATDSAGAIYNVQIEASGSYIVDVQFGDSQYNDKTYGKWNVQPTSVSYDLFAGGGSGGGNENQKLSSSPVYLNAGLNTWQIGSGTDGGYYTHPWCSITVRDNF